MTWILQDYNHNIGSSYIIQYSIVMYGSLIHWHYLIRMSFLIILLDCIDPYYVWLRSHDLWHERIHWLEFNPFDCIAIRLSLIVYNQSVVDNTYTFTSIQIVIHWTHTFIQLGSIMIIHLAFNHYDYANPGSLYILYNQSYIYHQQKDLIPPSQRCNTWIHTNHHFIRIRLVIPSLHLNTQVIQIN